MVNWCLTSYEMGFQLLGTSLAYRLIEQVAIERHLKTNSEGQHMKNMKNTQKAAMGLALGLCLASASSVLATNEFDYSSVTGANINFIGGGQFNFSPTASFSITDSSFGTGANGLLGGMNGTYTIGTVNNLGGGIQEAAVTGSGLFTITDASSVKLTGTLVWNTIIQSGAGSTLNYLASVNLTGLTYSGANVVLQDLAAQHSVMDTLDFTFTPAQSLSTLATTTTTLSTGFSGSINAALPDGGTTVALLGGALTAMGIVRSKLGKK